ncbi:MAG: AraC family transcriptional regulator [Bacteroidetes bacterium]|nr:AraC family transcriptional regulator [Bacteroidota bacterium]
MEYRTYEPCDDLSALIKCYWSLEGPAAERPERQTIVPDGCMEMIFHYGDAYRQHMDTGDSIIQPLCFVIGQLTRPLEIEPTGRTGIFSVRFLPHGFFPFTSVPLRTMENTAIPLEELFGPSGREFGQRVIAAGSTMERIRMTEQFLLQQLTDQVTIDRIVASTVGTIMTVNGTMSVAELSDRSKVSRRQLERRFASVIGLSPKQLSKTVRLQAALTMVLSGTSPNLTAVAHESEYFDQAHFAKDFKELTGVTPKEFYGNNVQLSSLFYGPE